MTAFFASAIQGIGPILGAELAGAGLEVKGGSLFDGRNDVVPFEAKGTADLDGISTAEDVFVEVATARRHADVERLARALCRRDDLERAVSVAASQGLRPPANATFRVIGRVRSEGDFRRTELRDAVTRVVAVARPRWRIGDPAQVELWALEVAAGRFRLGLRVTGSERRQHGGRVEERSGALRPTVAAALVRLAGPPSGPLVDPFCGSGTVLREAAAAGWTVIGADLARDAIRTARANVHQTALFLADTRMLPLARHSCAAIASNLPFGEQFRVDDPRRFYAEVLGEIARVVAPGGHGALLVPEPGGFGAAVRHQSLLRSDAKFPVRLLGQRTTLWHLRRT